MTAESVWVRVRAGLADELIRQGNVPDAVEDALTIMDEGGTFGEAMRALEAWGRQPVGHDLPGRVAPSGRSAPARAGEEPSEAASGHMGLSVSSTDAPTERRECGVPADDGSGRVCRRICAPGRDYHGGGHWFADPDLDGDAVRESTARWIVTGEQPESPLRGQSV